MRKCLFFVLALVLCVFAASAAQAQEQELISVPALSAGFGPSLEAANIGVANPFRLAAYAMDAQGSKISCANMTRYAGKEFFIPRSALSLSAAELKAAYSACLTQAHAGLRPAATTITTTATSKPTTATSTPTPSSTTATTNAELQKLQKELRAAENRLDEVQKAAEKRFAEIRSEERTAAEEREKRMKADFDRQLAAATQAAAGNKVPDPRVAELEDKLQRLQAANKVLEEENTTLKNKLAARGGVPPGPAWHWDGLFQKVGLKHTVKRVVEDPKLVEEKMAALKRLGSQAMSCSMVESSTELPDGFSLFGGQLSAIRGDCATAKMATTRETLVLAWNPIALIGYGFLITTLALAWPGYKAMRKFLNPGLDQDFKFHVPVVDLFREQLMRKDPAWNMWGKDLIAIVHATLQEKLPKVKDVVVFSFVEHEVWVRTDSSRSLEKVVLALQKNHPSLIPEKLRRDGGGYPYTILRKHNYNSTAPGTCATA